MTVPLDATVLTFSEEMLVLLLEDGRGTPIPFPRTNIKCALAGAVLMDLAFANRIDTDLETLVVIDRTPTGNFMLDRTLAKIGGREDTTNTLTWIKVLAAEDADLFREQALVRLVQHGILVRFHLGLQPSAWHPGSAGGEIRLALWRTALLRG